MCLQEFLNPFCEEAQNAFSQPNASISQIAVNLRLKRKTNVSFRLLCWVFAQLRELNPPSESESEKHGSSRSCVSLYPGELEQTQYWEISASKTKTELPNRTAFNVCVQLTELNWCVFARVFKPFLRRSGKRIFHPNPSISEVAGNLRLKLNTNVSFRLLCCVFAYLREFNLPWDSESEKRVSSRSCVWIFQSEWE